MTTSTDKKVLDALTGVRLLLGTSNPYYIDIAGIVAAQAAELAGCKREMSVVWRELQRVSPWSEANDMLWSDEIMTGVHFLVERAALEAALERAAKDLPARWTVSVTAESGSGWVELFGPDGDGVEFDSDDRTLAQQVAEAIKTAKELSHD